LQLRTISRHLLGLTAEYTRQNNRLHAAKKSAATPRCVVNDLKRSMASLERRILRFHREARELVRSDETILKRFELLIGIPGIAEISAV
jgi:transposase